MSWCLIKNLSKSAHHHLIRGRREPGKCSRAAQLIFVPLISPQKLHGCIWFVNCSRYQYKDDGAALKMAQTLGWVIDNWSKIWAPHNVKSGWPAQIHRPCVTPLNHSLHLCRRSQLETSSDLCRFRDSIENVKNKTVPMSDLWRDQPDTQCHSDVGPGGVSIVCNN